MPTDPTAKTTGEKLLLYGVGLVAVFAVGKLLLSGSRCSRLKKKYQQALERGDQMEADRIRLQQDADSCEWKADIEQSREIDRYIAAKPQAVVGALGDLGAIPVLRAGKMCGCKIKIVRAKGNSKRFAATCPGSPMTSYVSKKFALKTRGKAFCLSKEVKLLKPFTTRTGKTHAAKMWKKWQPKILRRFRSRKGR